MQIGLYNLTAEWQKIEDIIDGVLSAGSTYQIQARGRVLFLEAETAPDNKSLEGVILENGGVAQYVKGEQDLYVKGLTSASINITELGA